MPHRLRAGLLRRLVEVRDAGSCAAKAGEKLRSSAEMGEVGGGRAMIVEEGIGDEAREGLCLDPLLGRNGDENPKR